MAHPPSKATSAANIISPSQMYLGANTLHTMRWRLAKVTNAAVTVVLKVKKSRQPMTGKAS